MMPGGDLEKNLLQFEVNIFCDMKLHPFIISILLVVTYTTLFHCRLPLCEWHYAVDKVPEMNLLFPSVGNSTKIPWTPNQ